MYQVYARQPWEVLPVLQEYNLGKGEGPETCGAATHLPPGLQFFKRREAARPIGSRYKLSPVGFTGIFGFVLNSPQFAPKIMKVRARARRMYNGFRGAQLPHEGLMKNFTYFLNKSRDYHKLHDDVVTIAV